MSRKKGKIEIATKEDVERYAGEPATDAKAAAPDQQAEPSPPLEKTPEEQIAEWKDKFMRAKADFQNLQRRSQAEHAESVRYANAELVKSLLGLLDDFERTLEQPAETDDAKAIMQGVRLMYDNFVKSLQAARVETIDPQGQAFDPSWHQALMYQPSTDVAEDHVLQVAQKGYRLDDRLLRAAKVIVAKAPQPESDEQNDQEES